MSARPIRVLLYSPLSGLDPPSGDTTYTEALIASPPAGVEYTTYADALASGTLLRRGRRPRHGTVAPRDAAILGARLIERALRSRWLFPEETWFVTVDGKVFDLVHSHIFTLRQVGHPVPMVSSAGYPLSLLYRFRDGWSEPRARRADRLEIALARALGSHRPGYWAPGPEILTVYTEHYRQWLINRGAKRDRVLVVGQGLPDRPPTAAPGGRIVGFVGRDFVPKGGPEAVAAFRELRARVPDARLIIVTSKSSAPESLRHEAGVEVVTDASREDVLDVHLPRFTALLAPTRSDCGVPFAVIEALRAGVPVILADSPWLDSRLTAPGVQRASMPSEVAAAAERLLLDGELARAARLDARAQFELLLSLDGWHSRLRAAYDLALAKGAGSA